MTCHIPPSLGPYSHIQQQQLGGAVPEPPEITALVGDGGEGVDKVRSDDAGAEML